MIRPRRSLNQNSIEEIIEDIEQDQSVRSISSEMRIPESTLRYQIRKYKRYHTIQHIRGSGRPATLSQDEKVALIFYAAQNPRASAADMAIYINSITGKIVCQQIICNVLNNAGLHGRVARKVP
ncbi:hypothetical protein ENBRE01_2104 [Enteropsectra breve]|nr:hypothetical protein ENBRE01_2104 [Enteropsectra breve]